MTNATDAEWWRDAVVYQIYPRSFADGDGDRVGDLRGLIDRVPYLASLGLDAIWLSPFYPSVLVDGGYDIDDHRAVDPRLGTLADIDSLVAELNRHGMRLIVDIVANHTSNRHAWFQEALASEPGSPARSRYHFRDGRGPRGDRPPADWPCGFGGNMWTRVPDGQWYLHIHAAEQPDLNWDSRDVRDDFLRTLRFWADRGVAGFRVDVAHLLAKNLPEVLPTAAEMDALPPGSHPLLDRDEVHDIYAEWRALFDEYDPPLTAVAEAWVPPERRVRYARPEGLGQSFNFDLLRANWNPAEFRASISGNLRLADTAGSSSTWVLSNHDVVRHSSRYGLPQGTPEAPQDGRQWLRTRGIEPGIDPQLGRRRARAAILLELALPGSVYLYQGEELGLPEVPDLPDSARHDPTWARTGGVDPGRDGCRVPIPWTMAGPSFGFTHAEVDTFQPEYFGELSVEAQSGDPASMLELYRAAITLRRTLRTPGPLRCHDTPSTVLHFERPGGWHCVTTFSDPFPAPGGTLLISSSRLSTDRTIPPDTTAWFITTPEADVPR